MISPGNAWRPRQEYRRNGPSNLTREWVVERPSFHRLENVFFIMDHTELPEHLQVLLLERPANVMPLLVLDVADDGGELGMGIGEGAEPLLLSKSSVDPVPFVDEAGGSPLLYLEPGPTRP